VLTLNSGPAVVALLASVHRRDRSLAQVHATSTRVDGAPAIRLDARERIAGQLRRVTSTHVYVDGAELVALVPAGS
jgi:hypothetical protein